MVGSLFWSSDPRERDLADVEHGDGGGFADDGSSPSAGSEAQDVASTVGLRSASADGTTYATGETVGSGGLVATTADRGIR